MKKAKAILTLLVGMTGMAGAFAQETEEEIQLPVFGVGLHIEQIHTRDLAADGFFNPSNNIIMTVNIKNAFRIEPEFGIAGTTDKDGGESLKQHTTKIGCGFYGMFQRGQVNLYAGAMVESLNVTYDDFDFDILGNYYKQQVKSRMLGFGPVLGAEYFLGRHFSFGGRVMYLISNVNYEKDKKKVEDKETSLNLTTSGLQVKFYF